MKRSPVTFQAAVATGSAFADRGFLAIATFASSILLGRWAGPEELGQFALFAPIVFGVIAFHEALVTAPYNVLAISCRTADERRRYLGGVLVHTLGMALAVASVFALLALVVAASRFSSYAALTAVLAPVIPCVLIREFARRVVYADMRPLPAALLSFGVSVIQILLMVALHQSGRLSAVTSLAAMGAASLAGGMIWLFANRQAMHFDRREVLHSLARNWAFGRWAGLAQVGEVLRVHMFPWLLALAVSEREIGVFAACATLAGFTGPAQVALSNLLLPYFAAAYARGGIAATRHVVRQAALWNTIAMTAITAAMVAVSARLVPWVYGAEYVGTQWPLLILLAGHWVAGVTLPPARALFALRRPDADFACKACGIAVTLLAGVPLVLWQGIEGAAVAYLAGALANGLLSLVFYQSEVRRQTQLQQRRDVSALDSEPIGDPTAANEALQIPG